MSDEAKAAAAAERASIRAAVQALLDDDDFCGSDADASCQEVVGTFFERSAAESFVLAVGGRPTVDVRAVDRPVKRVVEGGQ